MQYRAVRTRYFDTRYGQSHFIREAELLNCRRAVAAAYNGGALAVNVRAMK